MEEENRIVEDVQKIMGYAKLDRYDLKDTVQCLHFVPELDSERIKLMEIDDEVLQHLNEGERLTIRGDKSDLAVLCTNNKTYQLREQETSNSLLIIPECSLPEDLNNSTADCEHKLIHRQVCAMKLEYFELTPIRPRLKKLKELLESKVYSGEEEEEEHQGKKYTYTQLLDLVQASEAEVLEGLKQLQAFQLQGYMRMMSFDFLSKVMSHVVQLLDEQSWSADAVPVKDSCDILQDLFKREVVCHVLKCFSDGHEDLNVSDQDASLTCKLGEDKVCRFFAEMILRPLVAFKLDEFEKVWQQSVPEGFNTSLYQLEGVALIDRESNPATIKYFPVMELPEDVNQRFNKLFTTKEKWTMEEITPYIKEIATGKTTVGSLLTKHARASTVNGVKMFNSKRPLH